MNAVAVASKNMHDTLDCVGIELTKSTFDTTDFLDTGRHDRMAANKPVNHGKTVRGAGSSFTFNASFPRILSCKRLS